MTHSQADRMTGRQTLAYGSETINFSLSFSPRRRLSITVEPHGEVVVKAPAESTFELVLDEIRKKGGWIIRQRDQFAAFGPAMPPKRYVSGETHRYLGRQYRLRVTQGKPPSVKLIGRYFEIVTPDKLDTEAVQTQLDGWYRRRAQRTFTEHLERSLMSSYFRRLASPEWSIRRMKRRWGSCTKDGTILLNVLLIQASPRCIDYVITHELCHLIHHNHDAAFFRLLDRVMPDWRERKQKLESHSL
jgi:predicted metal-dependent hydrolase